MKKYHRYTKEQIEYIREIAPNCTASEIVKKFNNKYNLNKSNKSVASVRFRNGIKVGKLDNSGQFNKGYKPWNKGIKGIKTGFFKPGREHNQYKAIGSERKDSNGFTLLKIGDPDIWVRKHYYIYEEHYGKVPEGCIVIFADRNRKNFSVDNLILVTRRQHSRLHRRNLIQDDTDLTKVMLNVVKLEETIEDIEGKIERR